MKICIKGKKVLSKLTAKTLYVISPFCNQFRNKQMLSNLAFKKVDALFSVVRALQDL